MEFLLKTAYYGVTGVSSLIVAFFFLANLFGTSNPSETWRHKVIILTSGLFAISLLAWAYRLGHFDGQWIGGLVLSIVAVLAFGLLALAGMFLFTSIHWQ
jgi:hypothetical protein